MKLSIITALYNNDKYIEKCIRSVYTGSLLPIDDFEFIIINDGSTDNSSLIVEDLQKEFSNLYLVNKDNGGQSTARNIGFELAKGDYIFCLDSDDFVDMKELIKALNYAISKDLDMLPIQLVRVEEDSGNEFLEKDYYKNIEGVISGADFLNAYVVSGAMCRYFYKSLIIKENNLRLIEGIYHEDEEFVIRFLSYVDKISYDGNVVYYYLYRHNSTTNNPSVEHRVRLINDIITIISSLTDLSKENVNNVYLNKGLNKKIQQLSLSVFLRMKNDNIKGDTAFYLISRLSEEGNYPLKLDRLKLKHKAVGYLFNIQLILNYLFSK